MSGEERARDGQGDRRDSLREAAIAAGFVLLCVVAAITVVVPALSEAPSDIEAQGGEQDAGVATD